MYSAAWAALPPRSLPEFRQRKPTGKTHKRSAGRLCGVRPGQTPGKAQDLAALHCHEGVPGGSGTGMKALIPELPSAGDGHKQPGGYRRTEPPAEGGKGAHADAVWKHTTGGFCPRKNTERQRSWSGNKNHPPVKTACPKSHCIKTAPHMTKRLASR